MGTRASEGGGRVPNVVAVDERTCRELADFAPVMIWRADTDMQCDWFNKPWLEHAGRPMEKELGFGWAERVHPDDYERCIAIYVEAFEARRPFTLEYRLLRHDGEYRWLLDNGAPFQRGGGFAGYFGSCVDITSYRMANEAQDRLIHELDHRVKNTLAIVQALARQSFASLQADDAVDAFERRLTALAGAHDIITRSSWGIISFRMLLGEVIQAWGGHSNAVSLRGPDINVLPKVAVTLSIALHELCTNAIKYGSLSVPEGRVEVSWDAGHGEDARFLLRWQELGGPRVHAPAQGSGGLGTRMLKRALASEIDGEVELQFEPGGFNCLISAPLQAVGTAG